MRSAANNADLLTRVNAAPTTWIYAFIIVQLRRGLVDLLDWEAFKLWIVYFKLGSKGDGLRAEFLTIGIHCALRASIQCIGRGATGSKMLVKS